jgi:glycosyltransferase involved in cell wall biosynthesis
VSELVSYKRLDLAIRYFSRTGRKLKVAGDGPQARDLRRAAGKNVEFCGRVPDDQLRTLFARCRAFVLPGEEDFGMTAVEAVASGKAVIALGRGGVLESVPAEGAFLFDAPEEAAFGAAVERFEAEEASIPHARCRHGRRDSRKPNSIKKCGRYCIDDGAASKHSGTSRARIALSRMAARGRAADADEQSRSRGC